MLDIFRNQSKFILEFFVLQRKFSEKQGIKCFFCDGTVIFKEKSFAY